MATVGLSTGDREEGDTGANLVVATYERALGLILSGELNSRDVVVVADELQIVGEEGRGANIETLCALLKQRGVSQFVALTATVENADELAAWLGCKLVLSRKRDVPLVQEIWFQGGGRQLVFGEEKSKFTALNGERPYILFDVVNLLLANGRGPILVFTETRREAASYAAGYSAHRTRVADGIQMAEQLELFSEETESSDQLRQNAERKVTFHSADLSQQERQVIEKGFIDAKFEVCFATSTLAAGVNFPFQTVIFPKLTYQYGGRDGVRIARSEYRNMSGRAGRLGMHASGYSVLLPTNEVEANHAKTLVLPENDRVVSHLSTLSMRRMILTLVASKIVESAASIESFWKRTLYWHQVGELSRERLDLLIKRAYEAVEWLIIAGMFERDDKSLVATPLGKATAHSGLLPTTAASFARLVAIQKDSIEADFTAIIPGIIHWACSCEEFIGETPSRFLPYPGKRQDVSMAFLSGQPLLAPLDRVNVQLARSAHALVLYVQGVSERRIAYDTGISSGNLHRLALDVSWIIEGLQRISAVPQLGCSQRLGNQMAMLARRVRWGAPAEALDMIRIAEKHGVPGFGRQRAMAILASGLTSLHDIANSTAEKLKGILRNDTRVKSFIGAVSSAIGFGSDRMANVHGRVAKELGIEEIVKECDEALGQDYEVAIIKLLGRKAEWKVTVLDDSKRQNVPDILLELGQHKVLIECKTCTKQPPLINKGDAFAVLQKASDFDPQMRRVTLGKPGFEEHCKIKAQASPTITLADHRTFMEAMLRVLSGKATAIEFVEWLGTPGLSDLNRLPGKPTYSAE
jgi:helicase